MKKIKTIFKNSYIAIILLFIYIPLFFSLIFSFTKEKKRGDISFEILNLFSSKGYEDLLEIDQIYAFLNSLIIGLMTGFFATLIALLVVYALWRQKNKIYQKYVDSTSRVLLINPDVVSASLIAITFVSLFGVLVNSDGFLRAILAHIIIITPYAIVLLYPKSEKMSKSLFEASNDLGYNNIKTWFKIYLRFMLPSILISFFVCLILSFDDFIITRTTSDVQTIGTRMYSEPIKLWTLAIGSIMLILSLLIIIIKTSIEMKKSYSKKGFQNE